MSCGRDRGGGLPLGLGTRAALIPSCLCCSHPRQLGEDHEKTKESSEYLKCLTQQAVALQRTMNEIYRNGPSANIPPLKVCLGWSWAPPSLTSQTLHCGLSFLPPLSSQPPAWPVSWNSSMSSMASSSFRSGEAPPPPVPHSQLEVGP